MVCQVVTAKSFVVKTLEEMVSRVFVCVFFVENLSLGEKKNSRGYKW